mmetsp:Transcript_4126/g.11856  ORF Transcript_4126/g.11856 Transcript_4126/m.11856 type:complete len:215 (+) Transcript_4126:1191-1835(+)
MRVGGPAAASCGAAAVRQTCSAPVGTATPVGAAAPVGTAAAAAIIGTAAAASALAVGAVAVVLAIFKAWPSGQHHAHVLQHKQLCVLVAVAATLLMPACRGAMCRRRGALALPGLRRRRGRVCATERHATKAVASHEGGPAACATAPRPAARSRTRRGRAGAVWRCRRVAAAASAAAAAPAVSSAANACGCPRGLRHEEPRCNGRRSTIPAARH